MFGLIRAWLGYASYWVRPYDMLADRRRWFWQPRTSCARLWNAGIFMPAPQFDEMMATIDQPDPAPALTRAARQTRRFERDGA